MGMVLAIGALFIGTACQDNLSSTEFSSGDQAALQIEVNNSIVPDVPSKGMLTGTEFPAASDIGLTVVDASGTTYDGKTIQNIKYTYNGTFWKAWTSVFLSEVEGTVYAYYPYDETVTDITKVSVDVDTEKDYMYASETSTVTSTNNTAELTMKHVLTAVSIKITKGTYTNTGNITAFTWKSPSAAKTAKLNAKTGELTNQTGQGEAFDTGITAGSPISMDDNAKYLFMAVPTNTSGVLTFTATMDGQTFEAKTAAITLLPGKKYQYTLQMDGKAMVVSAVNITDWSDSNQAPLKPSL